MTASQIMEDYYKDKIARLRRSIETDTIFGLDISHDFRELMNTIEDYNKFMTSSSPAVKTDNTQTK